MDCWFSLCVHIFLLPKTLKTTDKMNLLQQRTIFLWTVMIINGTHKDRGHIFVILEMLTWCSFNPSASSSKLFLHTSSKPSDVWTEYCATLRILWFPHESYKLGKGLRGLQERERYWVVFVNTFWSTRQLLLFIVFIRRTVAQTAVVILQPCTAPKEENCTAS